MRTDQFKNVGATSKLKRLLEILYSKKHGHFGYDFGIKMQIQDVTGSSIFDKIKKSVYKTHNVEP